VARDYLIDTNIASYWFNPKAAEHAAVKNVVERLATTQRRLFFSHVSIGEVEYGYRSNRLDESKRSAFVAFLDEHLPLRLGIDDPGTTAAYGDLRARLFARFAPKTGKKVRQPEQLIRPDTASSLGIQENDLWIAAQAIAHDLVLVTHDDMNHLKSVAPELIVEDWATARVPSP